MIIDINAVVKDESFVGKKLWVCDYRKTIDKKASRHVKPTEIYIAGKKDFDEAGLSPRIYYSAVGFATLKKDGSPNLKKLIPPFDNTGYRSYAGIGVAVFDNENECIDYYNGQVEATVAMYEIKIQHVIGQLSQEMQEIKNLSIAKRS
jgi:hypothetical protein